MGVWGAGFSLAAAVSLGAQCSSEPMPPGAGTPLAAEATQQPPTSLKLLPLAFTGAVVGRGLPGLHLS